MRASLWASPMRRQKADKKTHEVEPEGHTCVWFSLRIYSFNFGVCEPLTYKIVASIALALSS